MSCSMNVTFYVFLKLKSIVSQLNKKLFITIINWNDLNLTKVKKKFERKTRDSCRDPHSLAVGTQLRQISLRILNQHISIYYSCSLHLYSYQYIRRMILNLYWRRASHEKNLKNIFVFTIHSQFNMAEKFVRYVGTDVK